MSRKQRNGTDSAIARKATLSADNAQYRDVRQLDLAVDARDIDIADGFAVGCATPAAHNRPPMKRSAKIVLAGLGLSAAMQLVRCERTNPVVSGDIEAPADVKEVLRRACYDCHSNETRWPWYAQVAPISWLLYRDVAEGRRHLNFSEWDKLPAERRRRRTVACSREVKSGDMPPWFYLPLHRAAKLSDRDQALIQEWASAAQTPPIRPGSGNPTPPASPEH